VACDACGAAIRSRQHITTGKRAPIDVEPVANGNIVLVGDTQYRVVTKTAPAQPGELTYVSHFATCPDAQRFRGGGGPHPQGLPAPDPARAFGGETYDPKEDYERLTGTLRLVFGCLTTYPGKWWTLRRLSVETSASEASVSARLRDLRKPQYGGHTIERRRAHGGLYEYRLQPREGY
jgi:hypothetical protein